MGEASIMGGRLLAPVYNRLETESRRESENDKLCKPRHSHIIELIKSKSAHILCLQEFWFNQDFVQLYESDLSKEYKFFYRQRTHYADDSLVILISKQEQNGFKLEIIDRYDCLLCDVGNRIGLLLRICLTIIDTNQTSDFLLLNLHLTFPHNSFDRNLRF
ncbi:unnamed protein product [Didymodactylos carnosus]|uniref:Endonuclease/exonuclease/phosphatase domain-containing protein n=2 Tax=Didymodactylos carnosus TaxID=1234261 RepID=A0A8S2FQI2_9BILA|nr:unnamed protein product [Didymodactylos carnosus]CAF4321795.1 unnamed protein product [Didymodactylos carnosus]